MISSGWPHSITSGPTDNIELVGHEPSRGSIFVVKINEVTNEIVTGSADHSLRIWDLKTGRCKRELFKNNGHHEWVTNCDITEDGNVISGAMDNQIIKWTKGSVRGIQIGLHSSVSGVICVGRFVITSGYDGCVILWDTISLRQVSKVEFDAKGITQMCLLHNSSPEIVKIACGNRSGTVGVVQLTKSTGDLSLLWKTTMHKEAIVSLSSCQPGSGDEFVSGGGDGRCAVWRDGKCVWLSSQNRGTITFVNYEWHEGCETPRVIYGTSTNEIHIKPLALGDEENIIKVHKAPVMAGVVDNGILLSGDATGMLLCHKLSNNLSNPEAKLLWGFGALKMAVRDIAVSKDHGRVVVVGEEAVGMMLVFE